VSPQLACWYLVACAILVWYPVRFTGEWVETLAGALFLAAAPLPASALAGVLGICALAAVAAERAGGEVAADPSLVACAAAEARALRADIVGDSLSPVVLGDRTIHRRVFTLWREGDLDSSAARRFAAAPCAERSPEPRRRYGVDPWGTAYWVRARTSDDGRRQVVVYSFGPNRRRDGGGDDVIAGPEP
jgi:hypothetical protein